MPFLVKCPNPSCSMTYTVQDTMRGRPLKCKTCSTRFDATPMETLPTKDVIITVGSNSETPLPQIGRYVLQGNLGSGAFGTVFRAYDPQLDRLVALKVLRPEVLESAEAVERFQREAKSVAKLHHPAIVPVHDCGRDGDKHYIAYALIDGRTLASVIEPTGMAPKRAAAMVARLADALAYAHDNGILHRDVKPGNVMLDKQDQPFLVDFGLARYAANNDVTALTRTGVLVGTPAYMAPEQLGESAAGAIKASDLYALGVTLYHLLTGSLPFRGSIQAVIAQILFQAPMPPNVLRPGLDPRLEAICLKAMARKPEDRFADGRGLAAALTAWMAIAGTPPPLPLSVPRRRRRWVLAATGLILLTAGMAAGALVYSRLLPENTAKTPEREANKAITWPAGPKGPEPQIVVLDPGEWTFGTSIPVTVEEEYTVTIPKGDKEFVAEKRKRTVTRYEMRYSKIKTTNLLLFDRTGNRLDPALVLTQRRSALLVQDGENIDPYYLEVFKKGALIVKVPGQGNVSAPPIVSQPLHATVTLAEEGRILVRYVESRTPGELELPRTTPPAPIPIPAPAMPIPKEVDKLPATEEEQQDAAAPAIKVAPDKAPDVPAPPPAIPNIWLVPVTVEFRLEPDRVRVFRANGTALSREEWSTLLRNPTRVLVSPGIWPLDSLVREVIEDDTLILVAAVPGFEPQVRHSEPPGKEAMPERILPPTEKKPPEGPAPVLPKEKS